MVARNEFVEYTLELLADLGAVRARSMFGGYGLYLDDLMFGIIADDVVYFKVDDTNRDIFLSAGLEPFRLESKNAVMSYYTVPEEAMDEAAVMCLWARRGVEAAQRGAKTKRPGRKRKPK